mgnify:CR=1 FL=1
MSKTDLTYRQHWTETIVVDGEFPGLGSLMLHLAKHTITYQLGLVEATYMKIHWKNVYDNQLKSLRQRQS